MTCMTPQGFASKWRRHRLAATILSLSCFAAAWTSDPTTLRRSFNKISLPRHPHDKRRPTVLQADFQNEDSSDQDETIEFYDDFGGALIGETGNAIDETSPADSGNSLLQDRLQQLAQTEQAQQQLVADNWKEGFWNVWGCSLDPYPPATQGDESTQKIVVTCLRMVCTLDDGEALLVVGRSDGSLVFLKMVPIAPSTAESNVVVTYFENKLSAKPTEDGGMTLRSELQRSEKSGMEEQMTSAPTSPFDILAQVSSSSGSAVVDMLVLPEVNQLWTISEYSPHLIQTWDLALQEEAGFLLPKSENPSQQLDSLHSAPIIAMKEIPGSSAVITVSQNGETMLWSTGTDVSILYQANLLEQHGLDQDVILSMDVDDEYLFLGSESGQIYIFTIDTDSSTISLAKSFVGFTNRQPGVSALCIASPGTLNDAAAANPSGRPPTKTLIAGNVLGGLKQWELIPTGSGLEYWPRMASQRLPGKAHVFDTLEDEFVDESASIRQLLCIQKVILAATNDGLRFWDPVTGQSLYEMRGLDFADGTHGHLSRPSLVVAIVSVLVTNGMGQYVCVHDFASERVTSENAQDMIQRDDEE